MTHVNRIDGEVGQHTWNSWCEKQHSRGLLRSLVQCCWMQRCPKVTPGYYPQVQAPIVHSPALWEQLNKDVLFFAFYYQQVQLLSLVTKSQPWSEIMINTCILCLNTSQTHSNECKNIANAKLHNPPSMKNAPFKDSLCEQVRECS